MTDRPAGPPVRHRWILLVPVLAAMVALTIREGADRDPAPAASSLEPARVAAEDNASYGTEPDGTLVVARGSLLAYDPGFASVRAGEWDVALWGGGAYVSFQEDALTVAAFDVPVIVRGPKGVAVIPSMRQWRAPRAYLPDAGTDPVAWSDALDLRPLPEHFAVEHEASIAAWRAEDGAAPRADIAASLLGSATTDGLADAALHGRPTRPLAAAVRFDADLRLYGLVHPSFRDAAWGFAPVAAGALDDDTWMATLLLPRLERVAATASPLTVRRWGDTLRAAFDASADRDALVAAVLPPLERDIAGMAGDGYPVRALRFAEALRGAVGTGAVLTGDALAAHDRLAAMTPESLRAAALAELAAPVASAIDAFEEVPARAVADPALEQRARERLAAHGAMFTKQTTVETAGGGTVDVADAVFALPSGDRSLRFRYDPEADTARAIVDGQAQPYAVPFRAYLEWEAGR